MRKGRQRQCLPLKTLRALDRCQPPARPRVFSIDPPLSRDLDDAIGALQHEGGAWTVDVCIADVPDAVKPDTPLDRQARDKAFSTYLGPMVKEPMLPRSLTETLSLLSRQTRNVAWVRLTLSPGLDVTGVTLSRIQASTRWRFSYAQADAALADPNDQHHRDVAALWTLARMLLARRHANAGALWNPDNGIVTDEEGVLRRLSAMERHQSHLIVQELMILANSALAAHAAANGIALLYRNHNPRGLEPGSRNGAAADFPDGRPDDLRAHIGRLAANIGPAQLGTSPEGHWGLNLPAYAWFTSPLRRYADLVNLRALFGEPMPEPLAGLAADLTARERENKLSTAEHLRARAMTSVIRLIQQGDAQSLRGIPFRRVVRAWQHAECDAFDILADLDTRLATATLDPKDVLFLLTEARMLLPDAMTERLARHVATVPGLALQIANHMLQTGLLQEPPLLTARQRAETLTRRALDALELPHVPDIETPPEPLPANPRSALNERAQACGATVTLTGCSRSGPTHAPRFTLALQWAHGETRHTASGEGPTKKDAERAAAETLLQGLPKTLPLCPSHPPQPQHPNPKGKLLERAVKSNATVAFSEAIRHGPDHAPAFTVTVSWNKGITCLQSEATAPTKKAAEHKAAADLIHKLQYPPQTLLNPFPA